MFTADIDVRALTARLSDAERRQVPFALRMALNDSAFETRKAWASTIGSVFDRPTPLTKNAVLYRKATPNWLYADIFLRNEASKGTPPSRYLASQVAGTPREHKPIEFLLRKVRILGGNEFIVPGKNAPLDQYGNVPGSVARAVLSDLQVARSVVEQDARSTPLSRAKRIKRNRKRAGLGVYFYHDGVDSKLPRGIYERMNKSFVGPTRDGRNSGLRLVYLIVANAPQESALLRVVEISERTFHAAFPLRFKIRLQEALRTAKPR